MPPTVTILPPEPTEKVKGRAQRIPNKADTLNMINDRAHGMSYQDIADKYNLTRQTIHNRLKTEEARTLQDTIVSYYFLTLPEAAERFKSLIHSVDDKVALAAIKELHAICILGHDTKGSSTYINQVFNIQQNNASLSEDKEELSEFIKFRLQKQIEGNDGEI